MTRVGRSAQFVEADRILALYICVWYGCMQFALMPIVRP